MPIDPQAQALLDQMAAAGGPPLHDLPVEQARQLYAGMAQLSGPPEPLAKVEERMIPVPDGQIPVRIYTPDGEGPLPLLVFFHGGGWVIGDLDSHDAPARSLAKAAGCVVVAVHYRLAPEHKFPTAAEDAYAATVWAADHAAELGADRGRVAVGGDSAGGNLAAVVALITRDRGGPALRLQLLIYPVTNYAYDTPSYHDNANGYLLTKDAMVWFWNHYLRTPEDGSNPYVSPLQATDLHGLAPALVITAEYDPLRDEGEAYAERLRQAGVPVESKRYPGMIHGFFQFAAVMDQSKQAMQQAAAGLRAAFTGATAPTR
ncbi:MAG: alpha/beta hydrolase [Dehalococcoidia bacterium]